jgi:diguanylate cyclase (GGDEF)-like protein
LAQAVRKEGRYFFYWNRPYKPLSPGHHFNMSKDLAGTRVTRVAQVRAPAPTSAKPSPERAAQPSSQPAEGLAASPRPVGEALQAFLEASRATADAESPSEALRIIVSHAVDAMDVCECMAYEYDSGTNCIVPRAFHERVPSGWNGVGQPLPLSLYRAEREVLESGEPLLELVSDPDLDPVSLQIMQKWGDKTCLTVPVVVGKERTGLLAFFDTERERHFSEAEMEVAFGLAALAGRAIHSAQLLRGLQERNERLTSVLRAGSAISCSLNLDQVLEAVTTHAALALGCDACAVTRGDEEENFAACDVHGVPPGSHVIQQRLEDVELDLSARVDMEARGERSRLVVPLFFGSSTLGAMILSESRGDRVFSETDIEVARGLAEQAAPAIYNARQYEELRSVHFAGLRALVSALGARERYTHGHAARVANYVALLGEKLGWPQEMVQRAEEASLLHDIGKLAVSDNVLQKPGPLSEQEWRSVRAHPETSEEILRPLVDRDLLRAIRNHHEKYDGSGYPDCLAGESIPPIARAICIADAYDAMSFRRPYRGSLNYEECRGELERGKGSQFDPEMVDAFLQVLADMHTRREYVMGIAREAARLIDGDKHKLLRQREDEDRAEYREIAEILRGLKEAGEDIRFLTTMTRDRTSYIFVVDPEESQEWKSHCGDELLVADDEMDHVLAGETLDRTVLDVDEFGVWISGIWPLRDSKNEIVGLVCADSPARPQAEESSVDAGPGFLASLLGEAGKRVTRAEFDAATDSLTGLYNHRYLHEHLDGEISRSANRGSSLAILFVDIDHFKVFNDLYGHSFGDAVLRAVAQVIGSEVRRGDVVARYGGEEFVAVLTNMDLSGGRAVAERIRKKIKRSPLVAGGPAITVSIGVAVFPLDAMSTVELIERADWAMYQAKRLGRDRVQACSSAGVG